MVRAYPDDLFLFSVVRAIRLPIAATPTTMAEPAALKKIQELVPQVASGLLARTRRVTTTTPATAEARAHPPDREDMSPVIAAIAATIKPARVAVVSAQPTTRTACWRSPQVTSNGANVYANPSVHRRSLSLRTAKSETISGMSTPMVSATHPMMGDTDRGVDAVLLN